MLNVLLADDEPYIIRGLAKLIDWESLGFTIIGEAYNGKELLSSIERSLPSLVIADISMPGMTGIDVLKEIQSRGLPTKVIFVSAYQEFSYAKDAVSYGAVDYLVKPVDRAKLEEVVMRTAALIRESTVQVTAQSRLQVFEQQQQQQRIGELFERLTDRERLGDLAETARELAGKHPGKCISVILV
ncbi:response regulator, partial [Paenibacillus sepulcri]|nr:response regulator [Paenibacillus sepulcri]